MRTINVHEAKTQLSRLLDDVRAGEEIILAKAGQPYARLVPINPSQHRELGFLPDLIGSGDATLDPLDDETLAAFEGDL
jgi:prevent-host-death family protein